MIGLWACMHLFLSLQLNHFPYREGPVVVELVAEHTYREAAEIAVRLDVVSGAAFGEIDFISQIGAMFCCTTIF